MPEILFQDILESNVFRNVNTFERYSVEQMCEITFLYVLTLCLLYIVRPTVAKDYAYKTLLYPDFTEIRFADTDLGNLITGVVNAEKFFDKKSIALPTLQIKRLLREIKIGDVDRPRLRALVLKLSDLTKKQTGNYNNLRREICDLDNHNEKNCRMIADQLYSQLRRIEARGDIVLDLHKYLISKA